MPTRTLHPASPVLRPSMKRGFTFIEVMFAVMLLGLGFIMVAAIFPVAIRQQQSSMEDTTGVAVAKHGLAVMQQLGVAMSNYHSVSPATNPPTYTYDLTQDNKLHSFFESVNGHIPYNSVKGDLIQASDRRFAWIPVAYRCATPTSVTVPTDRADVYLLAVEVRDKDQFLASDRDGITFKPKTCYFYLTEGDTAPDTLTFTQTASSLTPYDDPNGVEGAYVWIADDQVSGGNGRANGRYYRLGAKVGTGTWQLQPGYDMPVIVDPGTDNQWGTADDTRVSQNLPPRNIGQPASSGNPAVGFIVGRSSSSNAGLAMDLFALPAISVDLKPQQ